MTTASTPTSGSRFAFLGLALGRISELAAEHGLSVYDATYLELAVRRKLPLASRDEALRKAAQSCHARPSCCSGPADPVPEDSGGRQPADLESVNRGMLPSWD